MKLLDTLKALSTAQKLALVGAVAGVVFAMSLLVQGAVKQPMGLLYAGLDPMHTGEVIAELEKRGVEYEIRGEAIFVPNSDRDSVRFALAKDGLPQQSVSGYELLDDVNGFSITSEMYNATYWRAKEGELTRTVLAIPGVSSARVHIGASLRSGFSRSGPSQTASVTLVSSNRISASQAEAIQYLVALAVSGLDPADVAVIDPKRGMLAGPNIDRMEEPGVVAEGQSSTLEQKILRLLEARVGPGNARVSVTVDVNRQRQRVSEVVFDPNSRVIRNRTSNDTSEASGGGGGGVTVSSNLPQGAGSQGGGNSTVKNSTESVVYDINETRRETETLPGEIERISVAVLLNEQVLGFDANAEDSAPLMRSLVADFEQLILSGAGLNADRGDSLTVDLMPFQELEVEELTPAPGLVETLTERYFWSALQAILLGLVVIVLGFGVVRPLLAQGAKSDLGTDAGAIAGTTPALANDPVDPLDYLKDYTRERQDETASLLQEWLNEDRKALVNE
ncbi:MULTISPECIES: flagellar basal-body MS-ring/collar protein FliF [unclassified Hyphomonas]|uniref:flagellar basal-body MS-ring/collar protein FliF n=2 Tax=Hyphomonas TaxID=85 RepID=UPI000C6305B0|nr:MULTISPECIES: flagellar basal-body MS-ring/collar protein FliF [unclassified Hyphomonas]MAN92279.1 flagellar M-ring protein FliF [Hyphomonadaceae bacterium]|tara:strand:- start:6298 stop:7818 length:1521 start_codon:yes stop_codon:yes gene_type:complete